MCTYCMDDGISIRSRKDLTDERKSCCAKSSIIIRVFGELFKQIENIARNNGISSVLLPDLQDGRSQNLLILCSDFLVDLVGLLV